MARIMPDTEDPSWLEQLDLSYGRTLSVLQRLPFIHDALSGNLDHWQMRRFLVQVGKGIIQPFPVWLDNMIAAAEYDPYAIPEVVTFLQSNRREEEHHWQWWQDMAEHWGVTEVEFMLTDLDPHMDAFRFAMDDLTRNRTLPVSLSAVCYCIETGAARMTQTIAPALKKLLSKKERQWLEAHAQGDEDHSRDARELLKAMLYARDRKTKLVPEIRQVVSQTGRDLALALREAYEHLPQRGVS